uniref:LOW QUALITY PROTEIN: uncharacterized protein LOC105042842 n=1 Tax=Elaeis guineensis var. tenera TaxID=51953 RepID=A0A6I9R0Z7_ELAGV|nr:LOW QUALITY PROTEIN: uncharacterized protein LOC105042842 [Elaeis guineensis]
MTIPAATNPLSLFRPCLAATKIIPLSSPHAFSRCPLISFNHRSNTSLFRSSCSNNNDANDPFESFSVLSLDIPWDAKSIWGTFAAYFFSLHIPLSFGGLSVIAQMLHQPVLDPLTMALSINILETTEYVGALTLLHYTTKPQYKLSRFFLQKLLSEQRSSIKASAVAVGFLIALVLFTSILADQLIGQKDVNNPILKEILLYSPTSKMVCFFLYCLITPLLEETVYRGFLLTSLASTMKWWQAVIISSCIFSAAHFSGENSLQLFLIGCVLGSVYCWTGNLSSSFTVHSVYNAGILIATALS